MIGKNNITAAASRLFVEKGFEKTTMEDISKALGIQKGSLYHHIKSKAGMFYDILILSFIEPRKRVEGVIKANLEPAEKLRRLLIVHFENIQKNSLEYQILLNERRYMLSPTQERIIRRELKAYENCFIKVLREGVRKKTFRSDLHLRVIVSGILGMGNIIYKWFSAHGPLGFGEIARIYAEMILNGIKK